MHSEAEHLSGALGRGICLTGLVAAVALLPAGLVGQQESVSTWDAAEFRVWGFVPYWSGEAGVSVVEQLDRFAAADGYHHVSDVLYFGGVRPNQIGGLAYHATAVPTLNRLVDHAGQHGFRLHLSLFDVAEGSSATDATWTSIISNPAYRANFVGNVTALLQTYGMSGFNFDWERPNTVEGWGNYTQLARELGEAIRPLGMEVSVCDFGFTDSKWDDSPLFDARVYDQLFIMGYHYPAFSGNALNNNHFANGKLALTGQGAEKAFRDEQLTLGIGLWGSGGPATVTMRTFAEAHPDLAYDTGSLTGTYTAINGSVRTGTWAIESRQQVREKTQLAIDRNMPGLFTWIMHYDARDELSLQRVMHHYAVFRKEIPDLNLDGRVDAADAHLLADNIGSVPGWTGTNTPARFDRFYLEGNWEAGDWNGNGFVNQADADWLAERFAALDVALPERLPYTGVFEAFGDSLGLSGPWHAWRESDGSLRETGNFTQHSPGHLFWAGSGAGAGAFSESALTIRNQNAAEAFDNLNTLDRLLQAELADPIGSEENSTAYFSFLVRANSGPLLAAHRASSARTLALEFLNEEGDVPFQVSLRGAQQEFAIGGENLPPADADGFLPDTTYLVVGKISSNAAAAGTMQLSWFSSGAEVGDCTRPGFPWMLSAEGAAAMGSPVTRVRLRSPYEANFTVNNLWIRKAEDDYSAWTVYYEALHGLPAGALGDPAGDLDGDGVSEILEYAFEILGADPLTPDRSVLPQPEILGENLVLDYPRDRAKADLTVRAQASVDLSVWHAAGDPGAPPGFSDTVVGSAGSTENRRASLPLSAGGRAFLRLEVTRTD